MQVLRSTLLVIAQECVDLLRLGLEWRPTKLDGLIFTHIERTVLVLNRLGLESLRA